MDAVAPHSEVPPVHVPRLLVVDDDASNLKLLCRLFERHGCRVDSACTGAEALRRVRELQPDLVVLDVMLPDLDGREVCRRIKAAPATAGVLVALISSTETSSDNKVAGLGLGADDYITRPVGNKELLARMDALLRIQRALTARRLAEERLAQLNATLEQRVIKRTAEKDLAIGRLTSEIRVRQQAQARSEAFAQLGQKLAAVGTPRAAAEVILETARQLLGWDACFLQLSSKPDHTLLPLLAYDTVDGLVLDVTHTLVPGRSLMLKSVTRDGRQLILRGLGKGRSRHRLTAFGDVSKSSASLMFVPVRRGATVSGLLSIQSYTADHYTAESLQTLQALADHCWGALERLSAEASRRESEKQFAAFMEHAPICAWIKDENFRFIYVNPLCCRFLGRTADKVLNRTAFAMFPREAARRIQAADQVVLEQGESTEETDVFLNSDREPRDCWMLRFLLTDAAGRRYIAGIAMDITERVRAEQAARALPHRILEAQETERRRVARELHDGVSQLLASVKFRVLSLESWFKDRSEETIRRDVTRVKDCLVSALREVRSISHQLHPRELDDLGLSAAIQGAVDELLSQSGLKVVCELIRFRSRLPLELELALYRIFQEAVTNALKHARATRLQVTLSRAEGGLMLRVEDNGCGFRPATNGRSSAHSRFSLGLLNMRERAEFIGGTLSVRSAPHEGTTIEVWAPLPARSNAKS